MRNATLDFGRYNIVLFAAATAVAAAAAIGLADLAGYEQLVRVVAKLNPLWVPLCFGGQVLSYLGYVLAVLDMARVEGGPRLSFSLSTRTVLAGFGVFAATHASGGFAVDYWTFRRSGLKRPDAIARVLGLGALEYAVLAPAALISAIVLLFGRGDHVQDAMTYPWLLVIPGVLVALWLSSPKRAERFADPGDSGWIRGAFSHGVAGVCKLRTLLSRPRHWQGVAGVALYYFGDIVTLWAALTIFGAEVSTPKLILAYATGYVLSRRSLPAGGAGIVEFLMTFALVWVGLGLAPALMGVLLYRAFNFWLPIIPALAIMPSVRELRTDWTKAEAESQ